jgi:PAS domain S-box-containing protein
MLLATTAASAFRSVNSPTKEAFDADVTDSLDLPIIVVDRDLKLINFNSATAALLSITTSDVGRPLGGLWMFPEIKDLKECCEDAIEGISSRRELRDSAGSWFLVRIEPCTLRAHGPGVLITLTNITFFRATLDQAIYEREYTKAILNTVVDPLVVLDEAHRIQAANHAFYTMFEVSREQAHGVRIDEIGERDWDIPRLHRCLKDHHTTDPSECFEFQHQFSATGPRTLALRARGLGQGGKLGKMILLSIQDITERKQTEALLLSEANALSKLNELSSRLWTMRSLHEGLDEMLTATIGMLGADLGNIQLLNEKHGTLIIEAQRGFQDAFLDAFREVSTDEDSACGRALRSGERIVIEDVEADALYAPMRAIARSVGYRAMQSTPLLGRNGRPLGLISTYFRAVHRPSEQELRRMDLYIRQASDFIERCRADEALQASNEELSRFNRIAVGRELRMLELKREVNELRERQGEPPRYPLELEPGTKSPRVESPTVFHGDGLVPLESILCTEELHRRPARPPDFETESRALVAVAQALANSPGTILQTIAEKMLEIFLCGSAGFSLLTNDEQRFSWDAIAGAWNPHLGGGTPRGFGPCGDVLDCNAPLLFRHWERRYPYLLEVTPLAEEGLVVPFYIQGKAVGTLWIIAHDDHRKFDSEDLRLLERLGLFASGAYQALKSAGAREQSHAAISLMEDAVQSRDEVEAINITLRESDRRKGEFLAMLAHELRNPMAAISNAVQILLRTNTDVRTVRLTSEILDRQAKHMVRQIDDLLDVSRISQGKIELRKERIELATIVNHAVEVTRPLCERLAHTLTVTLPPESMYLDGDLIRLVQVVGNLLNNACKFTNKGGRIWLTVEQVGGKAVIRVRDTGIGIAADQHDRIFEMFTQLDTSLERAHHGLGLGLTLVQHLVDMHGGTVEARSEGVGRGSEFVIQLPVVSGLPSLNPETSFTVSTPMATRRILVVDDNRDSAEGLSILLKLIGHEVQTAHDGLEAVEATATFQPDVILLDIGMPRLNGHEAARRIREQQPHKGLKLVALTGWGQEEDRRRSREAGFDAHLVKPIDLDALTKLLAELGAG